MPNTLSGIVGCSPVGSTEVRVNNFVIKWLRVIFFLREEIGYDIGS